MSMGQKKVESILCVESLMKRRPSMNRAKHGKILEEHLKDRGLFITCPPRFGFLKTCSTRKGLGLQEKDLGYKEKTWATRKGGKTSLL